MGFGWIRYKTLSRPVALKNLFFKIAESRFGRLAAKSSLTIFSSPKMLDMTYLPIYENIELPESAVTPISVAEKLVREASYHVILKECMCRGNLKCKDYPVDLGCLFLGEGAKEIKPDTGDHVTMEQALGHLERATNAGLITMAGKFYGDALLLGVKNHHRMMTICHCCPCCCIGTWFKYGPKVSRNRFNRLEGVKVEVGTDCNGCGLCVDNCFIGQISLKDGRAVIGEECKGCGRCAMICPKNAISVTVDNPEYFDEAISRIGSLVKID